MQTRNPIARLVTLLCAAMIIAGISLSARAQETSYSASFEHNKESVAVNVLVGQSRVINFDKPIGRFSVSNSEIAEAILVAPDQVLVNGKAFGQVNFIAWEQSGGKFIVFDVFVRANLSLIDSQIRALFPKDDIRLSQANGSVVISGNVTDPTTASKIQSVIEAAGFKTVNMLASPARNALQVQLQVRVAEVSRNRMKELGTSYGYQGAPGVGGYLNGGTGPSALANPPVNPHGAISGVLSSSVLNLLVMGGNSLAMLRMLQTQGAVRSLAEPNIIAMDGQQASFLAGGEFPVPVVQSDGTRTLVTIVWKEYGVRLNFKPTIIDEDHIRLEMEPEVSTIDFANGVKFDGFVIPGLKTRRAKTGIELRDGQSFALAGLMDNSESRSLSKVPVIGDIPILGALFKSKSYQKNETELMFIVTAQMVKPVNRDDLPQMRGIDGLRTSSPLGVEPKGEGITGQSGYSMGTSESKPATTPQPAETKPATTKPASPAETKAISSSSSSEMEALPDPPPMPAAAAQLKPAPPAAP
ncbi:MAG TPA: type II and III secretion system protein family protein [Pyrinomonadaceae bacterium]|nr:type II and III secretion system protein family protein [Pyrinomonadaceae bacterium]